jgi:flagella basal body P-ring formation protein FlgA
VRTVNAAVHARCLTGLAALALAGPAAATSIDLRPFVVSAKSEVTLGDVAFVTSESLDELQRLLAMPVGAAPRAGRARRIDRDAIERSVRALRTDTPLSWGGAPEVILERAMQILEGGRIVEAARTVGPCDPGRAMQATRMPRDVELPAGEVTLAARVPAPFAPASRPRLFWVDIYVDARLARSVPVRLAQDEDRPAPACARAPGSARAIAPSIANPVASPIAAATLAPGVVRGEWATLHAGSGALRVESRVQALQDGHPGQVVRVKAPGASAALLAQVIGPHELEVRE